jgi:hypothetical protein
LLTKHRAMTNPSNLTESSQIFLSGRYFTAQEIQDIQETIESCGLSWTELVQTVCEHLGWVTPAGRNKADSCSKALRKLEAQGLVKLPARQERAAGKEKRVEVGAGTDREAEMAGTVRDLEPVEVVPVLGREAIGLWNEYIERYHGLGYKRPFGAHQRYFIVDGSRRRLGCLLFASSAWALSERDEWIGWSERDRAQRLNWVVANTRFLIFPWVRVRNLASAALSRVAARIGRDWQERYGYAPVLLETFVEAERYRGTCYQAANWIRLGMTAGRGRMDRHKRYALTPKIIYVYPLRRDFRMILRGDKSRKENDGKAQSSAAAARTESVEGPKEEGGPPPASRSSRRGTGPTADGDAIERAKRVDRRGRGNRSAPADHRRTDHGIPHGAAGIAPAREADPGSAESQDG